MGKHSFGKMGIFQEIRKASKNPPTKVFYWHKFFCKVPFIKKTKDFIYIIFSPSFFCDTSVLVMQNMSSVMKYLFGVWEKVTVVVLTSTTTSCTSCTLTICLKPLPTYKCQSLSRNSSGANYPLLFGLSLVNNLNCGLVPFCVRTVSPVLYRL